MSQHDMDVANQAGALFRADINLALQALAGNSSGSSEPAVSFPYQFWADTNAGLLKMRNAANNAWISIGLLGVQNLGHILPGTIVWHAKNAAPSGFLKCNGGAVSRATFGDLFSEISTTFGAGDGSTTFNLPELRGEFIRAWDDGRGIDTGRVFGSAQGDAIRNITGTSAAFYRAGASGSTGALGATPFGATPAKVGVGGADPGDNATITFNASLQVPTASENRPRSIALLACIKY